MNGGMSWILRTGIFVVCLLALAAREASAVTFDVRSVKCVRVVDAATRRQPLQKKVGAGMTESAFKKELLPKPARRT